MESISVNKFRENLKAFVDSAVSRHEPLRITRRNGSDFVVMSLEDWESEQETLYILQNSSIMQQIRESQLTHQSGTGYRPTKEEVARMLSADESK